MNFTKTKFMVINGTEKEKETICIDGKEISHCKKYIYLGAIILENPSFAYFIEEHKAEKNKNILKLCSFLNKNPDLPFLLKQRVLEACIFSSLLYSCETWFSDKVGKLNSLYISAIKMVLGVRVSTPSDVVLLEIGYSRLQSLIKEKQFRFFNKLISSRLHMDDDPFMHLLNVGRINGAPSARYIDSILSFTTSSFTAYDREVLKSQVRSETGSKFINYCELNPELSRHEIYDCSDVVEYHRTAFTRFRTGSHRLEIETGRWSRTPKEGRLCSCDDSSIQDEKHMIESCSLLAEMRQSLANVNFAVESFFDGDCAAIAAFIYKALKTIES